MTKSIRVKPRKNLLEWLGIGGLAFLVGVAGFALHTLAVRRYRLILRDEPVWLGMPAPFLLAGLVLFVLLLFLAIRLAAIQKRRIGWGLREGRRRGGPLQWEEVLVSIIAGSLLGTIGMGLILNCYFDGSTAQSHTVTLTKRRVYSSSKGGKSYAVWLTDWKNGAAPFRIYVDYPTYCRYAEGQAATIETKSGLLGYEWVSRFD